MRQRHRALTVRLASSQLIADVLIQPDKRAIFWSYVARFQLLQHQPSGLLGGHANLDTARSGWRIDDGNDAIVPGARSFAEPCRHCSD